MHLKMSGKEKTWRTKKI